MNRVILVIAFLVYQAVGINVMAFEKSISGQQLKQWSLVWGGDWRFGDYGVSVDNSGKARLMLFNTVNNENASGAGIVESQEGLYDRNAANEVRQALCDPSSQAGRGLDITPTDAAAVFSAACEMDGATQERQGHIGMLPENLFNKVTENARLIHRDLSESGVKKIWINALVQDVVRKNNNFLVTVRLINYGREAVSFTRPDLWSGKFREETLSVGGIEKNPSGKGGWEFELAGQPLENKSEFKGEVVTLEAGAHQDFVFQAMPEAKYKAGTYEFSLDAWMYLDWMDGESRQHSHVDFYSGKNSRKTITIDHDYPSTPQEREQWEAQHRASMSLQPVKPGETFTEDGLYRAVRVISGASYRSLQLKPFKAGDIATTENVRMPMESASGVEINGPVQWVWEASAPTRTKPFSSDYIEGTEHVCKPGAPCPRNGRWIERTEPDSWGGNYTYRLSSLITRRAGQQMPQVQGDAGETEWEWVGA
jgi:hypothetical protein